MLMEDVASIMNIPQTLRNVKVFHHQGTKHFRIVRHGDKASRNGGIKLPAKKVTRHPYLINGKKMLVKKKGKVSHKAK